MAKLNWWRTNKIAGRRVIDHRFEEEDLRSRDRAGRYLAAVEKRQMQVRQRPREYRTLTASSSSTG
jgi:hypothetical protein